MPKFDFRVEWEDGYLYITEECGSGCKYPCNTPAEAGEYVTKYIEDILFQTEYDAAYADTLALLGVVESYYENREY